MQQPTGRILTISVLICIALGTSLFWGQSTHRSNDSNLEWRHYGKDLHNTRFLDADQINSSNVSRLCPAWVFHTGVLDRNASLEVSPIVAGGHMFVTTGHDDVFALDALTGEQKWAYHPLEEMPPLSQIAICCGRANRGVAFGRGRVFVGRLDDVLVALDATFGKVLWKVTVVDFHKHFSITMAPQFVEGLVIVGVSGGEFKVRGQVVAYAAETGKEVWRFFTTVRGSTWEGDSWKTGGATVWQTPAVDRELGLLYLATGNAAPDLNGAHRKGSNLYSSSIVALELHTGAVRWYFQEVHHDLWDYDSAQPPLLFEMARNGEKLPALGHCSKNGNYYILNRATGQPLFPVNEVPVAKMPAWQHPWPTQPVSAVEPLTPLSLQFVPPGLTGASQYTPPHQEEVVIQPGDDGGCEFPPAAYSPRTRFVYYGTRYEPASYHSSRNNNTDLGSI